MAFSIALLQFSVRAGQSFEIGYPDGLTAANLDVSTSAIASSNATYAPGVGYNLVLGPTSVTVQWLAPSMLPAGALVYLHASAAPPAPLYVPVSTLRARAQAAGIWPALAALLVTNPAKMLWVLTLDEGVNPADPDARALITAAGGDPDAILGPLPAVVPAPG